MKVNKSVNYGEIYWSWLCSTEFLDSKKKTLKLKGPKLLKAIVFIIKKKKNVNCD